MTRSSKSSKSISNSRWKSDMVCEVDGIPVKEHISCQVCSILVGPDHHEKKLYEYNGMLVCFDCIKRRKIWKKYV